VAASFIKVSSASLTRTWKQQLLPIGSSSSCGSFLNSLLIPLAGGVCSNATLTSSCLRNPALPPGNSGATVSTQETIDLWQRKEITFLLVIVMIKTPQ
jgi:hypothetical protein